VKKNWRLERDRRGGKRGGVTWTIELALSFNRRKELALRKLDEALGKKKVGGQNADLGEIKRVSRAGSPGERASRGKRGSNSQKN